MYIDVVVVYGNVKVMIMVFMVVYGVVLVVIIWGFYVVFE